MIWVISTILVKMALSIREKIFKTTSISMYILHYSITVNDYHVRYFRFFSNINTIQKISNHFGEKKSLNFIFRTVWICFTAYMSCATNIFQKKLRPNYFSILALNKEEEMFASRLEKMENTLNFAHLFVRILN